MVAHKDINKDWINTGFQVLVDKQFITADKKSLTDVFMTVS